MTSEAVDLSNCDREPIHIPGSVQPHGALLSCGPDGSVVQASANAADVLGLDVQPGTALEDLVGPRAAAALADLRAAGGGAMATAKVSVASRDFDAAVSGSDGAWIVELEPADDLGGGASFELMRTVMLRLSAATSVLELCEAAASEVRALTGFDRVMIYRFDESWNGEVVAEDRREDLNPFLGLHYPATDIPAQARELYAANWLRLIADVNYVPSPLVPQDNPLTGRPLDLSSSALRSVSPIHIEYLSNMGVTASMSISLMSEGKLWGLVACHHYSGPHRPSQPTRAAAEFMGQVVSLLLAAKQRSDDYERRIAIAALQSEIAERVAFGETLARDVEASADLLLRLVDAGGVAVRLGGEWTTIGTVPDEADLAAVTTWLWRDGGNLVSTASLALDDPRFAHLTDIASGVLGVSIARGGEEHVVWFRPEVVQTVDWGGDPQNKVIAVTEDETIRLSPRKSFDLWKQTVQSTSLPWTELDRAAAAQFGRHLGGVVLHESQEAADVARTLQQGLAPVDVDRVGELAVAARYRTGGLGDVGGDWYDVLDLPGAGVAVIIGDVAGHGISAATTMGQLRHAARAYLLNERSPAEVLSRLNCLVHWLLPGEIATSLVAIFDEGRSDVRIASAGHLPPLAVGDGVADFVAVASGPALGVTEAAAYSETAYPLGDDALLLFTDGLVERRGESIDVGLARLADACAAHGQRPDFLDQLLVELVDSSASDDLAVLAVRRSA